jgi:hypothetical protein
MLLLPSSLGRRKESNERQHRSFGWLTLITIDGARVFHEGALTVACLYAVFLKMCLKRACPGAVSIGQSSSSPREHGFPHRQPGLVAYRVVLLLHSCCRAVPFNNSLHLGGLPFTSTRRPEPPCVQSLSYSVQRLNACRPDLKDDGQDVRGELVGLSHSGCPGAILGNFDV